MKLVTILSISLATSTTGFVPAIQRASIIPSTSLNLIHDVEEGIGSSWAGARYGDQFLHTGHWSQSETSGVTAYNSMDAPSAPRARSSHTGHAYEATETHGVSSFNAMDAAAAPRARSSHTGHAYEATETHGVTSANYMDRPRSGFKWLN